MVQDARDQRLVQYNCKLTYSPSTSTRYHLPNSIFSPLSSSISPMLAFRENTSRRSVKKEDFRDFCTSRRTLYEEKQDEQTSRIFLFDWNLNSMTGKVPYSAVLSPQLPSSFRHRDSYLLSRTVSSSPDDTDSHSLLSSPLSASLLLHISYSPIRAVAVCKQENDFWRIAINETDRIMETTKLNFHLRIFGTVGTLKRNWKIHTIFH